MSKRRRHGKEKNQHQDGIRAVVERNSSVTSVQKVSTQSSALPKSPKLDENTSRSVTIGWGVALVIFAIGTFIGGPFWGGVLLLLGVAIVVHGYFPKVFEKRRAKILGVLAFSICSFVILCVSPLGRRTFQGHKYDPSTVLKGSALTISLNSQPDLHPVTPTVHGLLWNDSYVYTVVTVSNSSESDVKNVHMHLETDHTFAKISQLTSIPASLRPTCPSPSISTTWSSSDGSVSNQVDAVGTPGVDNSGLFITNAYDVFVENFPAKDYLAIFLAATSFDSSVGHTTKLDVYGGIEGVRSAIRFARVWGTYDTPVIRGKPDLTTYNFDISTGDRPAKLSLEASQLPDMTLQKKQPHYIYMVNTCPTAPNM